MADYPLAGYPSVFGNKKSEVLDHSGPSSYPTGGETFSAQQLGWGGLEYIDLPHGAKTATFGNTYSGTYFVQVTYTTVSAVAGALPSVLLKWYVANGGAEVGAGVDLSGEYLRIFVLGV